VSPEGLDDTGQPQRNLTVVRGAVVATALVLAASLLLLTRNDPTPAAGPAEPTINTSTTSTTTTTPISETLRAAIPDVEGRLVVAVGEDPVRLVTWPGSGPKTTAAISMWPGLEIEFDRSGRYMGFLGPAMAGADSALYVGNTSAWHPLAVQASSFQWHARDPGRVAWAGEELLCHGQVHPAGGFTSLRCLLDIEGRLVGFDDTGYLLAMDSGIIVRLDPDGAELGRVDGDYASIGSDGRILVMSSDSENGSTVSTFSVADADLTRVTQLDWVPDEAIAEDGFTSWSPAASPPQIAFLLPIEEDTWEVQLRSLSGRLLTSHSLAGRYWALEWDWLGRYLLAAGVSDRGDDVIRVYDVTSRQHFVIEPSNRVQDIHLVRDPDAPIRFDLTSVVKGLPVK
jgi:hypothetical protein